VDKKIEGITPVDPIISELKRNLFDLVYKRLHGLKRATNCEYFLQYKEIWNKRIRGNLATIVLFRELVKEIDRVKHLHKKIFKMQFGKIREWNLIEIHGGKRTPSGDELRRYLTTIYNQQKSEFRKGVRMRGEFGTVTYRDDLPINYDDRESFKEWVIKNFDLECYIKYETAQNRWENKENPSN